MDPGVSSRGEQGNAGARGREPTARSPAPAGGRLRACGERRQLQPPSSDRSKRLRIRPREQAPGFRLGKQLSPGQDVGLDVWRQESQPAELALVGGHRPRRSRGAQPITSGTALGGQSMSCATRLDQRLGRRQRAAAAASIGRHQPGPTASELDPDRENDADRGRILLLEDGPLAFAEPVAETLKFPVRLPVSGEQRCARDAQHGAPRSCSSTRRVRRVRGARTATRAGCNGISQRSDSIESAGTRRIVAVILRALRAPLPASRTHGSDRAGHRARRRRSPASSSTASVSNSRPLAPWKPSDPRSRPRVLALGVRRQQRLRRCEGLGIDDAWMGAGIGALLVRDLAEVGAVAQQMEECAAAEPATPPVSTRGHGG